MKIGDVEKLLKVVIKKSARRLYAKYIYIRRFLTDIIYVLLHNI